MKTAFVVTDVTRMSGSRVCLAGYLPDGACIRPEIAGTDLHQDWLWANDGQVLRPFAEAEIDLDAAPSGIQPPHVEDRRIGSAFRVLRLLPEPERLAMLRRTESASLDDLFGATVRSEGTAARWIEPGQGLRSLGTFHPKRITRVRFGPNPYDPAKWQYKIGFLDHARQEQFLTITDLSFRAIMDSAVARNMGTPPQIERDLLHRLGRADVWLRVGLARPFDQRGSTPPRCYLQVNGIYSFPDYLDGRCFADAMPRPQPATLPPSGPGFGIEESGPGYAMSGSLSGSSFDWDDPDDIPF